MVNPVAPYRCLLPTVDLYITNIVNLDLFLCGCRTWICFHITHFYEEQRQPYSGSAWPACPNNNKSPNAGVGGFDIICTSVCNRCDSSTACRMCHLEPDLV